MGATTPASYLPDVEIDVHRLVCAAQLHRSLTDPVIASFLQRLPTTVRSAARQLEATEVVPVPLGWGGAVVRMRAPAGDLAVKVPHHRARVTPEAAGAATLAAADLGPSVVAVEDEQWYAIEWVPGGTVGELLVPTELDPRRLVDALERLWAIPTDGFEDIADQWRRVASVSADRVPLLAALGLDPDRVTTSLAELTEQLVTTGRRGFCHGDLHPGNILAGPSRWSLIDPRPGHGALEADLAFLLASAACGRPDPQRLREVCTSTGLDRDTVDAWALVFAGEFVTCLCATLPERHREIAGFTQNLRRL